MERAEAVAEIRRSAIYRVGVWFTRLLFSSFGLVIVLFLLAVLGGLGDAAINQWVPFAFGVLVFLAFAGIPISILFNIELASHMGWRLGADNPALLILLLRTFVRDVLPFRPGDRTDQLSTSAATGEAGPGVRT